MQYSHEYLSRLKNDLKGWFSCSWDDLATFTGLAEQTLHDAGKPNHETTSQAVRKLQSVHSLVGSLLTVHPQHGSAWLLREGRALLDAGEYDRFRTEAENRIFGTAARSEYVISVEETPFVPARRIPCSATSTFRGTF